MLEQYGPAFASTPVQVAQELLAQSDATNLVRVLARGILLCSQTNYVSLVRRHRDTLLIEAEAIKNRDTIELSNQRSLRKSETRLHSAFNTALLTRNIVFLSDWSPGKSVNHEHHRHDAYLPTLWCVPLISNEQGLDLLCLQREAGAAPFHRELIDQFLLLSAQAAVSLDNIRYRAQIEHDNAQRENVERILRDSENTLAEAQRISKTGSWRWNVSTDVVAASKECRRIYDLPDLPRVTRRDFMALVHPNDRSQVESTVKGNVSEGKVLKHEYRLLLRNDEVRYIQVEGHPQTDDSGAVCYVGVVNDITERKLFENHLQNVQAKLSRALRLATIGELAASIIHEIAQPLTGIVTNTEACLRWIEKNPTNVERADSAARRALHDAERAIGVSRSLRSLVSRSGTLKVPVDLDDTIEEVALMLNGEIERANIRLLLVKAAERPVSGDRFQLQQVLMNLMCNGIDALRSADRGSRLLTVSSKSLDESTAQVTIHDTGEGFHGRNPEDLFDALFTTKPGGMGMGLRVCRSIVEAHGGKLIASSDAEGTKFQCTLPYVGRVGNSL
ncbi:ATP-binding protein [Paraburkholderia sp. SIMBA_054]|uniref:ATP-binding protein n=1 Tax=Paraburkholderia sp. SIMBA_054 TaxID=3085795 RepID=UPI00397D7326